MKINLEDRSKIIRRSILDALYQAGRGHIGGALSCVDILVTLYYGGVLKYDPKNPTWEERDRFILSKGHAAIALYAVLADLEFFSKQELSRVNKGYLLGEHPDQRIPGVEINSGSLGHGLSIACGIAYANKLSGNPSKTYVLLGDGECYEGSVWEAAMFAGHHELDNLIAIIDRNGLCIQGSTEDINQLDWLHKKFGAFGWEYYCVNGHHFMGLQSILTQSVEKPYAVIANTIKGRGISFMEDSASWHHGTISKEIYERAKVELD